MALQKAKGSEASSDEEGAPESGAAGKDYRAIAKDAAKDGDWDAMVDALCDYFDSE